ncbi:MAG: CoA transferase, partial [Dehalococcoidia bacterium]
ELAIWINGPSAGYMLGDLGAEVIKIEQYGLGDPMRGLTRAYGYNMVLSGGRTLYFEIYNRSKKSIALDLKKEKGREVLYRLVQKSDVFFTNYSKSVMARLKADYETLSKYNPRLIYCINSGYGTKGPESEKRVFDSLVQARSGFMMTMAGKGCQGPVRTGGAYFDQLGGTMTVYGILAALVARERMGIGQEIEVSMLSSAMHLQQDNVYHYLWKGESWEGHRISLGDALFNMYRCADDKWIMLSEEQSQRFWHEFCQVIGIKELEHDARFAEMDVRLEHAPELIAILEERFASKNRGDWLSLFEKRGCGFAYAAINSVAELVNDPQVLANDYIVEMDHPTMGRIKVPGVPVKFSKTPAEIGMPPPEFGQHVEEVLLEVGGYSWDEIVHLKEEEVIP